jgi:hypothetical protein
LDALANGTAVLVWNKKYSKRDKHGISDKHTSFLSFLSFSKPAGAWELFLGFPRFVERI